MSGELSSKKSTGTTLVELMVYMTLFSCVLSCVYWVLITSMRYYNVADASVDLQSQAMRGMATLTQDLSETTSMSVYDLDASTPKGIIFASPRNSQKKYTYNAYNELLWKRWVCYYIGSNKGVSYLYRKEVINDAGTATIPAIPAGKDTISGWINDNSLTATTVAKYVDSVNFEIYTDIVTATYSLENSPSTDKRNTLQITSQIRTRN
ncbi:MAG: hypothetical protein RDV48_06040 [Candidatus Eremiobacteraeota bacterium]|nr:hypothetical protein [Candidatus Eremiobacteraeota bacterium]